MKKQILYPEKFILHTKFCLQFQEVHGSLITILLNNSWYRDKKTPSYFCPFLVVLTVVCQLHHHFSPEILQCYFAYSKVCFGGISGYFFRVLCCKENGEIRNKRSHPQKSKEKTLQLYKTKFSLRALQCQALVCLGFKTEIE